MTVRTTATDGRNFVAFVVGSCGGVVDREQFGVE
jgi:hypothetical protein